MDEPRLIYKSQQLPFLKNKWECKLVNNSLVLRPNQKHVPNAFHRYMQKIMLGFEWKRID